MLGKKILVEDDSLTIQKVIRLALSGDGYEIQTVSDGKEALEQASLFRPDICIIDVSLPYFDAYQVREQLLSKPDLKQIPIILMSSAFEKVDEARSQKLGFAGHLIKPFDPSHLRSTLLSVSKQTLQNDPVMATINEPFIKLEPPHLTHLSHLPPNLPPDLPPLEASSSPPPFHSASPLSTSSNLATSATHSSDGDDIQQLTKSTFQMSGLDQQDWGMIEPGRTPPPPPSSTPPSFQSEVTSAEVASVDVRHHIIEPRSGESRSAHDPNHHVSLTSQELENRIRQEVTAALGKMQEEMKARMEKEFMTFSRTHLAEMAERIIKAEIHKLLTDPPA